MRRINADATSPTAGRTALTHADCIAGLLVQVLDEELEPAHREPGEHTGDRRQQHGLARSAHEHAQLVAPHLQRFGTDAGCDPFQAMRHRSTP